MDLQLFLVINVVAVAALIALQAIALRPPGYGGWLAVNLLVVAVAGGALAFGLDAAGFIALAVFLPLVLAPALLSGLAQRRSNMGRYADAARLSRLAAVFHPTRGTRFNAALSAALARSEVTGDVAPLTELMRRSAPDQRATVETLIARSRGRWDEVLAILAHAGEARRDLRSLEVRALGETGRIEEMLRVFEAAKTSLVGHNLVYAELFVLAFTGRRQAVERLLSGQLASLESEVKTYWRAIAAAHEPGAREEGLAALRHLAAASPRPTTRRIAEHHLARSLDSPPAPLSPGGRAIVAAAERHVSEAARITGVRLQHSRATLLLLAINLAAFGGEVAAGGSENMEVLVDFGALWPPLVVEAGEWWRLVAPSFLHYGALHLVANMLMLLVLGRLVEATWGAGPLILAYLVGGVGSTAAVLALMWGGYVDPGILVGASGAIFALFGMIVARAILDWRRWRDVLDRSRLLSLATIMALQFVIDVAVPHISFTAHLAGFGVGLLLGLAIAGRDRPVAADGNAV